MNSYCRIRIVIAICVIVCVSRFVVLAKAEASKEVVCVDRELETETTSDHTTSLTTQKYDRKFYKWSARALRKVLRFFLLNDSLSKTVSVISSRNRVVRTETDNNVELQVYRGEGTCTAKIEYYELIEPLYLELGGKVYHVEDYAYSPVATVSEQSISDSPDREKLRQDSLADSPTPRRGWWQWWIPWRILRDRSTNFNNSKYKVNNEAFAGGSHGEVWRGRRKCLAVDETMENCSTEPLIFKRLKIEKGFRTLEAGLREIHFGKFLQHLPQESRGLFTQYIEHFIGDDGELWIVFADHGLSLRSFLYTAADAGGFIVFQQSWLWTVMRVSLHSHQNENTENVSNLGSSIETLKGLQVEPTTMGSNNAGKLLIRSILKQVRKNCGTMD
jgi:hypothetical protein